jgi:hypothetical protein
MPSSLPYNSGTTVRLTCTFYDFADEVVRPTIVILRLYNYKQERIEEFNIDPSTQHPDGHFYYDYITPVKPGTFHYEWWGEIDGKPSLLRDSVTTQFV